jgi:hypothetical protein
VTFSTRILAYVKKTISPHYIIGVKTYFKAAAVETTSGTYHVIPDLWKFFKVFIYSRGAFCISSLIGILRGPKFNVSVYNPKILTPVGKTATLEVPLNAQSRFNEAQNPIPRHPHVN